MIFDTKGKPHIECESCFNTDLPFCKCCIYSGNVKYPNMYNIRFEPEKKILKQKSKENIYEGKIL